MGDLFSYLSDEVFALLKGSGRILSLYNEEGNSTWEPKEAYRFYSKNDGMMLILNKSGADSCVTMNLSNGEDVDNLMSLITSLRNTCTRHNVLFSVRKYDHQLSPREFAFSAKPVQEGYDRKWGTTKSSYERYGSSKLIIRHFVRVNEEKRGSRSRPANIKSLFVENAVGERFYFPYKSLRGGRAFAQHINQGGNNWDKNARKIYDLTEKHAIVRAYLTLANKSSLTEEVQELKETLSGIFKDLNKKLFNSSQTKFYERTLESYKLRRPKLDEEYLSSEIHRIRNILGINEDDDFDLRLHTLIGIIREYNGDISMANSSVLPVHSGNEDPSGFDLVSLAKNESFNQKGLDNIMTSIRSPDLSENASKLKEETFQRLTKRMKKIKEQKDLHPVENKSPSSVWAFHAGWLSTVVENDNLALALNEMCDRMEGETGAKLNGQEKGVVKYLKEKFNAMMWPKYLKAFKELKESLHKKSNTESFEFHMNRLDEFFGKFDPEKILEAPMPGAPPADPNAMPPADPNAMGGDPNAMPPADPNAMGGDPNAMGGDPNAALGAMPPNDMAQAPEAPPAPPAPSSPPEGGLGTPTMHDIMQRLDQIDAKIGGKGGGDSDDKPEQSTYGVPDDEAIKKADEEIVIPGDQGASLIGDIESDNDGIGDDLDDLARLKKCAGLG